jgi:hypothetical protein
MKLKYKLLIGGAAGGILGLVMLMISKYTTAYYIGHLNININSKDTSLLTLLFMSHIFVGIIIVSTIVLILERYQRDGTVMQ